MFLFVSLFVMLNKLKKKNNHCLIFFNFLEDEGISINIKLLQTTSQDVKMSKKKSVFGHIILRNWKFNKNAYCEFESNIKSNFESQTNSKFCFYLMTTVVIKNHIVYLYMWNTRYDFFLYSMKNYFLFQNCFRIDCINMILT